MLASTRVSKYLAACAAVFCAAAPAAHAQGWKPDRNIEIVVPSAPGGSNDKTARTVERILLKHALVPTSISILNKPGGGNAITMNYVNQRAGDAHVLMVGTPTILTGQILGKAKLGYRDFTPLASLLNDYVVFVLRTEAPIKTGPDLIAQLRKDPGALGLGFATALGSHNHIAAGLLVKAIGGNVRGLKTVAFKGSAAAITALLGGHLDMVTTAAGNAAPHVAAGKLRIVGIAADRRMPGALSDVPTWKEQGVDLVFGGWRAIMGPKNLTPEQVAYWNGVLRKVVESEEWKADLKRNFWYEDFADSAKFAKDLEKDYTAMRDVLTELGLAK